MDVYNRFKQVSKANRVVRSSISSALDGVMRKTSQMMYDISNKYPSNRLDTNKNAPLKAMELVSALFAEFGLPTRPKLTYLGMQKNSANSDGLIQEGLIKIGAMIRTLTGHKADLDVPVIVRDGHLLDPAVFFYNGAPYIICRASLDQLVHGTTLDKEYKVRKMFQPPMPYGIENSEMPRIPIMNRDHMFSPGPRHPWQMRKGNKVAQGNKSRSRPNIDEPVVFPKLWLGDVPDELLDPAERNRDGLYEPGDCVTLTEDIEYRDKGGAHLILPKGEKGCVIRDMEGDGKMLYVQFHELNCSVTVPKRMLKSAATIDQVKNEVRDMIREGYKSVDIKDAMLRKYPDVAQEAIKGLD